MLESAMIWFLRFFKRTVTFFNTICKQFWPAPILAFGHLNIICQDFLERLILLFLCFVCLSSFPMNSLAFCVSNATAPPFWWLNWVWGGEVAVIGSFSPTILWNCHSFFSLHQISENKFWWKAWKLLQKSIYACKYVNAW